MEDDMKPAPKHFAKSGKLHHVLMLLGFSGLTPFAKAAGVSHETAYAALGVCVPKYKTRAYSVARIHQALHQAFMAKRASMSPAELALCIEWHTEWKVWFQKQLSVYCPGRRKLEHIDPGYKHELKRTRRKHRILRQTTQATLDALKWE